MGDLKLITLLDEAKSSNIPIHLPIMETGHSQYQVVWKIAHECWAVSTQHQCPLRARLGQPGSNCYETM